MDTGGIELLDIQPSPNEPISLAGVDIECLADSITEVLPSPPIKIPQRESTGGLKTQEDDVVDTLAAHEQTYREIVKILEREEGKLNGRRKQACGSAMKLKKLIRDTFELNALKQFNSLRIEYHRRKAANTKLKMCPALKASTVIATRLGKSDHYARRLREKSTYLHWVGEMQISKQGKGATHRSLLSEPLVVVAIQTWVKGVIPTGEGGYTGRVWCLVLKRREN